MNKGVPLAVSLGGAKVALTDLSRLILGVTRNFPLPSELPVKNAIPKQALPFPFLPKKT
jgi:hypothetical protein